MSIQLHALLSKRTSSDEVEVAFSLHACIKLEFTHRLACRYFRVNFPVKLHPILRRASSED